MQTAVIVDPVTGEVLPQMAAKGGGITRALLGTFVQARTLAGAVTVRVPLSPTEGQAFGVMDADSNAAANPITIDGAGQLIDGAATVVLNINDAFASFFYDRGQWRRLQPRRRLDPAGVMLQLLGDLADQPGAVGSVLGALPITSTGGINPTIGINAATNAARGSMSSADKDKLDKIQKQGPTTAIPALVVDWSLSGTYSKTLAAGANVVTFANDADGEVVSLALTSVATTTVTWPASVKWPGGTAPDLSAGGLALITLTRIGAVVLGNSATAYA